MSVTIPCRAQDPATCKYHGAELQANEALAKGDMTAFFTAHERMTAAIKTTPEVNEFLQQQAAPSKRARRREKREAAALKTASLDAIIDLATSFGKPTHEELVAVLQGAQNEAEAEVAFSMLNKTPGFKAAVAKAENPYMYRLIGGSLGRFEPTVPLLKKIANGEDRRARLLLASNLELQREHVRGDIEGLVDILGHDEDPNIREYVAGYNMVTRNIPTMRTLRRHLAQDESKRVRRALAQNEGLDRDTAEFLTQDPDIGVNNRANVTLNGIKNQELLAQDFRSTVTGAEHKYRLQ